FSARCSEARAGDRTRASCSFWSPRRSSIRWRRRPDRFSVSSPTRRCRRARPSTNGSRRRRSRRRKVFVAIQRKALIIGDAVPASESTAEVLQRFGFSRMDEVPSLHAATVRLRNDHFDLVFVPIDRLTAVEMALLEREIRRESSLLIGTAPKADPDLILRGMRAGVQEFLVSPPDPMELG